MSTNPPPGPGATGLGRRFEDAIDKIEAELKQAVGYVNDTVVPQVRRESILAMRKMAESLTALADRCEHGKQQPPSQPKDPQP